MNLTSRTIRTRGPRALAWAVLLTGYALTAALAVVQATVLYDARVPAPVQVLLLMLDGLLMTTAASWLIFQCAKLASERERALKASDTLAETVRASEAEVREREARLRAARDAGLDAWMVLLATRDEFGRVAELRFEDLNPRAEGLLGVPRIKVLGRTLGEVWPIGGRSGLAERYARVLESGRALEEQLVLEWGDGNGGEGKWLHEHAVPMGDRLAITLRDITGMKTDELALARAHATVMQQNAELEQVVYTVSHDLKSPLVTISGYLSRLRSEIAGVDVPRRDGLENSAERIGAAAGRMRAMIDDLLHLTRAGHAHEPEAAVDLLTVARNCVEALGPLAAERNVEVRLAGSMPAVLGDERRVGEILDNLLSNAIKYGCSGAVKMVEVSADLQGRADGLAINGLGRREVWLRVRDFGPGIAPADQERIFGMFQRLTNDGDGTGLGLAIVRRIARLLGGRAWVESELGKGATFVVALPAAEAMVLG